MESGIGSIETAIGKLFRGTREEIALTAYSITGGADLLVDWMEAALDRGVRVNMVVNRLEGQSAEATSRLRGFTSYTDFRLYDFTRDPGFDLHAKVIVVDRRMALVGSSNLSGVGCLTTTNWPYWWKDWLLRMSPEPSIFSWQTPYPYPGDPEVQSQSEISTSSAARRRYRSHLRRTATRPRKPNTGHLF